MKRKNYETFITIYNLHFAICNQVVCFWTTCIRGLEGVKDAGRNNRGSCSRKTTKAAG